MRTRPRNFHFAHLAGRTNAGRNVYHCLKDSIRMIYWFTLVPAAIDGEDHECFRFHFDARSLPERYIDQAKAPIDWVISALEDEIDPVSCTQQALQSGKYAF